jgi:hypothetical protein
VTDLTYNCGEAYQLPVTAAKLLTPAASRSCLAACGLRLFSSRSPNPDAHFFFTQTRRHSITQTLLHPCREAARPCTLVPSPFFPRPFLLFHWSLVTDHWPLLRSSLPVTAAKLLLTDPCLPLQMIVFVTVILSYTSFSRGIHRL